MSLSVLVLMPFAKKFNRRYELAIKRAVHGVGMRAERVDEQSFHHQGITDRIIKQIEEADVLIADMSEKNQNVSYEVGYAHAKNKLCILLTNDPNAIPFDLKNRQHIVFSGLDDLKEKLMKDLEALKVEMELFFDSTDAECVARVYGFHCEIKPKSQATSIRSKVKTNSELHHKNVLAHMINIKRRIIVTKRWEQFKLEQPIQLTWADTGNIVTDLPPSTSKYVNVFHIDHDENKLTIYGVSMPIVLSELLSGQATYRVTVLVMGRRAQLDIVWRGDWQTIGVEPTPRDSNRLRRGPGRA